MSKIVAIRSLQSADHAANIVPKILTINWTLTKRCNYDCSYCGPHTHDAVSPFVNLEFVESLLESCEKWCGPDRKIQWSFTGGEPFLDPSFIKIAQMIHSLPSTHAITVTTNGSLPTSKFLQAAEYITNITFSLHLERSVEEINKVIDTVIQLKDQKKTFVNVNVMFLPGRSEQVKEIVNILQKHNIMYIVRLITPTADNINSELKPYYDNGDGRKNIILKSPDEQRDNRMKYRIENLRNVDKNIKSYYSETEIELINSLNSEPKWHNVGIWNNDGTYEEINTDQLVSSSQINFKDWICFAGVDSIYIDWEGTIYRGVCLNDGPIGKIGGGDFSKTEFTICKWNRCRSNIDIPRRKCKNVTYLKLIT